MASAQIIELLIKCVKMGIKLITLPLFKHTFEQTINTIPDQIFMNRNN